MNLSNRDPKSRQEGVVGVALLILPIIAFLVAGILGFRLSQSSKSFEHVTVRFQEKQFFDALDANFSNSINSLDETTAHIDNMKYCTIYNQTVTDNGNLGCTIAYALYAKATDDDAQDIANNLLQDIEEKLNANGFSGTLERVERVSTVVDGRNMLFLAPEKEQYRDMKYSEHASCQSTVEYPIRLSPSNYLPQRKEATDRELYVALSCTAPAKDNFYGFPPTSSSRLLN